MSIVSFSEKRRSYFWEKVNKKGEHECWEWTGSISPYGYGHFWINRQVVNAQRASWMLNVGPIPKNKMILHKCHNRKCVNPRHLYIGTQRENMRDRKERGFYRGENHGRAKLSEDDVLKILELLKQGLRQVDIAARFGIRHQQVSRIKNGLTWKHITRRS